LAVLLQVIVFYCRHTEDFSGSSEVFFLHLDFIRFLFHTFLEHSESTVTGFIQQLHQLDGVTGASLNLLKLFGVFLRFLEDKTEAHMVSLSFGRVVESTELTSLENLFKVELLSEISHVYNTVSL